MKYIAMLLVCVLCLSILVGCKQNEGVGTRPSTGDVRASEGEDTPDSTGEVSTEGTEAAASDSTEVTAAATITGNVAPEVPMKTIEEYKKKYVPFDYGDGIMGESSEDHAVKVPAVLFDSTDAQRINEKLQSVCYGAIETLKNGEEGNDIFVFDYTYRYEDGILGIVLVRGYGAQSGGFSSVYDVYYLDLNTGKELTYEEYLKALGLTEEAVLDALRASGVISTEKYPDWVLSWLITDSKGSNLLIETESSIDGVVYFEGKFTPLS